MINKNNFLTFFPMLMATIGVLMMTVDCPAGPYRLNEVVCIQSEYIGVSALATSQTRIWKVVPSTTAGPAMVIQFFLQETAGLEPVCELEFASVVTNQKILWRGEGQSKEKTVDDGFLLMPGYPAPCDVLPVGNISEQGLYRDRNEAGGSVFIKTYHVSAQSVSQAEALAGGWINETVPDVGELVMVTATDKRGELAVRQLWPVSGAWWIYEETPSRRSWRIY